MQSVANDALSLGLVEYRAQPCDDARCTIHCHHQRIVELAEVGVDGDLASVTVRIKAPDAGA